MASNFEDTNHLKDVWILDSGSTIHVCNDAKYFINFDRQSDERMETPVHKFKHMAQYASESQHQMEKRSGLFYDYLHDDQDLAVVQLHRQFNHWIIKHESPETFN